MAYVIAFLVIELSVVAVAWRLGGTAERSGAGVLLTLVVATYLLRPFVPPVYHTVDLAGLITDLVGLIGFSWIGINARKLWPLWAASLQLLSTGAHLVRSLEIPVRAPVYYWMAVVPTVGVMILLLLATWLHRRRQRISKPNC